GAHVLLSTVPVNLRDSAPFASVHKQGLSAVQMQAWSDMISQAKKSFDAGRWRQAILEYGKAEAIDPDYANTQYRLGIAYANIEDYEKAARHFSRARDLDALRFRADSQVNKAIRSAAARLQNGQLTFVDSESVFNEKSYPEQPGWNLFLEHVHFNFSGNYLLAKEYAGEIMNSLGMASAFVALPEAEVARRIGYPNRTTVRVMKKLVKMVQLPPFTGQSNQTKQENFLRNKSLQTKDRIGSVTDQIARYEEVLKQDLGDWRLRLELVNLYARTKNRQGMYEQLEHLFADFPHDLSSHLKMANILHQDRRFDEEIVRLKVALNYTRDDEKQIALINGRLGVAYYNSGNQDAAVGLLAQVARNNPALVRITLTSYEKLIQIAKQADRDEDVNNYVHEVQRYGKHIVKIGQDEPWLYETMTNMLRLAGFDSQAQDWMDATSPLDDRASGGTRR
ncbi:MAG: tetratricopeptide repeat protein, partial [Gammaproteobacteria bacterium]